MATRKKDITTKKSEINGKIHNRKWKKARRNGKHIEF